MIRVIVTFLIFCKVNAYYDVYCLDPIKRPNTRGAVSETFHDALDVLDSEGIDYTLYLGTLLQMYRDCGLKPDATDLDVVMKYRDYTSELHDAFVDHGWYLEKSFGQAGEPGHEIAYIKRKSSIKLDIFFVNVEEHFSWTGYWRKPKGYTDYTYLKKCRFKVDHDKRYRLRVGKKYYKTWGPIPGILESLYGLDWRKPVPSKKFHENYYCSE